MPSFGTLPSTSDGASSSASSVRIAPPVDAERVADAGDHEQQADVRVDEDVAQRVGDPVAGPVGNQQRAPRRGCARTPPDPARAHVATTVRRRGSRGRRTAPARRTAASDRSAGRRSSRRRPPAASPPMTARSAASSVMVLRTSTTPMIPAARPDSRRPEPLHCGGIVHGDRDLGDPSLAEPEPQPLPRGQLAPVSRGVVDDGCHRLFAAHLDVLDRGAEVVGLAAPPRRAPRGSPHGPDTARGPGCATRRTSASSAIAAS